MTQNSLSKWLKMVILGAAVCGLALCVWAIPGFGKAVVQANPEFSYCYVPWLVLLWLVSLPCFVALVLAWKVAENIGKDRPFLPDNGRFLKWISRLAAADAVFFFFMNILYLFLNMNHPGIVLGSLLIAFAGTAVSVVCAVLAQMVEKAAVLQEQSDWTI